MPYPDNCPNCGVSFQGESILETFIKQRDELRYDIWQGKSDEEIMERVKSSYSPPYHWSRVIGIEDPMIYDGVSWWKCPDCEHTWERMRFSQK